MTDRADYAERTATLTLCLQYLCVICGCEYEPCVIRIASEQLQQMVVDPADVWRAVVHDTRVKPRPFGENDEL